jgi:hypothetical protein
MSNSTRRRFMLNAAVTGTALGAVALARAQAARLDEKDPQAVALGYVHDTKKVDRTRHPRHTADQKCSNCTLYQGKATDPWGGCQLFGTKLVAGPGWCSAWAKKP